MIKTGYRIALAVACTVLAPNAISAGETVPYESRPWIVSQVSNICVTPVVSCYLPGMAASGTPCWCNTPYGPVNGRVR